MHSIKIQKIGNILGAAFPQEVLEKLNSCDAVPADSCEFRTIQQYWGDEPPQEKATEKSTTRVAVEMARILLS